MQSFHRNWPLRINFDIDLQVPRCDHGFRHKYFLIRRYFRHLRNGIQIFFQNIFQIFKYL